MLKRSLLIVGFSLLGFFAAKASPTFAKNARKELPFSRLKHFQIPLEDGLFAVYRNKDQVLTSVRQSNFVLWSKYNENAVEADQGFGSLHVPTDNSERLPLAVGEKDQRIRGIETLDKIWFFLDSKQRRFLLWDSEQKIWLRSSDVVLDLIKPAADPRGEPTRFEIAQLRQNFTKNFGKLKDDAELVGGLASLPGYWRDRDGSQFILLLRVPGTPLLTVKCGGKNFSQCRAMRACFVHGLPSERVPHIFGLAVDQERQEILIGSPTEMRIMRFKAPSCYHVARLSSESDISLPEQLKSLSNIFIDAERNLWVTTLQPDLDKSASLFRWDAAVWATELQEK